MVKKTKKSQYQAFCHQCLGGGKVLYTGDKKTVSLYATSHITVYGHDVSVMEVTK